jgi:hypothetical protein
MRLPAMGFRLTRFRPPPVTALAAADFGHPTAESQRAGLDHLARIAMEQVAGARPAASGAAALSEGRRDIQTFRHS